MGDASVVCHTQHIALLASGNLGNHSLGDYLEGENTTEWLDKLSLEVDDLEGENATELLEKLSLEVDVATNITGAIGDPNLALGRSTTTEEDSGMNDAAKASEQTKESP